MFSAVMEGRGGGGAEKEGGYGFFFLNQGLCRFLNQIISAIIKFS